MRLPNNSFQTIFEGNGYAIRNLATKNASAFVGFFGSLNSGAQIRNLNFPDALALQADSNDNGGGSDYIGKVVGRMYGGHIFNVHARGGESAGSNGNLDRVGGLVGILSGGLIQNSSSEGWVNCRGGDSERCGGLIGEVDGGRALNSYVLSNNRNERILGGGDLDLVGGFVGFLTGGIIHGSFAYPDTNGEGNHITFGGDKVGGFVGEINGSSTGIIQGCYAMGYAQGGSSNDDRAGGFVGWLEGGTVDASYATGGAGQGDEGLRDWWGKFAGDARRSRFQIFGFSDIGRSQGWNGTNSDSDSSLGAASTLTLSGAGGNWNSASLNTLNAWDFGTSSQTPALRYSDLDGDGNTYHCANNTESDPQANAIIVYDCGQLLPDQRRTPF